MAEAGSFLAELRSNVTEDTVSGTETAWLNSSRNELHSTERNARAFPIPATRARWMTPLSSTPCAGRYPREAIISLDAGTWCLKASEALDHALTPSLFTPLDFASLGFAFPAAIGHSWLARSAVGGTAWRRRSALHNR